MIQPWDRSEHRRRRKEYADLVAELRKINDDLAPIINRYRGDDEFIADRVWGRDPIGGMCWSYEPRTTSREEQNPSRLT